MKNIAIIDVTFDGSHGKIAKNLLSSLSRKGYNVTFYYGRGPKSVNDSMIRIANYAEVLSHVVLSRITGLSGYFSHIATNSLIKRLEATSVDTIILLNIHGFYINESKLLSYFSKKNLRVVYIMADEYTYLGKCAVSPICETYITGYGHCPEKKRYPTSWFFDTCSKIIKDKEKCYKSLKRTVFVGPEFVVNNAKRSYLGKYMKTAVLDEAIDTDIYKPLDATLLRKELGVNNNQIVILCVASAIKGAKYFSLLAQRFEKDNRFVFIHIGNADFDCRSNFIHINYLKDSSQLAYYYSMADLFISTSLADTMSNTCIEAMSCGTPLLVFNISGMPFLFDNSVGTLITPRNVDEMENCVLKTHKKDLSTIARCRDYALSRYDSRDYANRVETIANNIV